MLFINLYIMIYRRIESDGTENDRFKDYIDCDRKIVSNIGSIDTNIRFMNRSIAPSLRIYRKQHRQGIF